MKVATSSTLSGLLYGVINSALVIPVSYAFCSIIFRDDAFRDHLQLLVKLVLLSSAVHQLCFTAFSSLPFAIGQVQDAGLIFLSAMAGDIVANISEGADDATLIATTLFILSTCTALLGACLIALGRMKAASVIQYLPMPAIGGYLAYIGFFCFEAALILMSGTEVTYIDEWRNFMTVESMTLILPGVSIGVTIYCALGVFKSPVVLPVALCLILVMFYGYLSASGISMQAARDNGWIAPLKQATSVVDSLRLLDPRKVEWELLPLQFFRWLGMFMVVAFSSCLDVAAIEMELGLPLDYNRELQTVGVSNLCSGLLGGYTGSYIFSQTIFTMRRGVHNRVCGLLVAAIELLVVALPISVTSYIPKFFFGALLVLIGVDLMTEWLIMGRKKMAGHEYMVCVATFMAIQAMGIEIGMGIGILLAMIMFVVTYASLPSVVISASNRSKVARNFDDKRVLVDSKGKLVTVSLNGYIFFGAAVKILEEVKNHVVISAMTASSPSRHELESVKYTLLPGKNTPRNASPSAERALKTAAATTARSMAGAGEAPQGVPAPPVMIDRSQEPAAVTPLSRSYGRSYQGNKMSASPVSDDELLVVEPAGATALPSVYDLSPGQISRHQRRWASKIRENSSLLSLSSFPAMEQQTSSHIQMSLLSGNNSKSGYTAIDDIDSSVLSPCRGGGDTEFLILDFTDVLGVDATAARSCFLMLTQLIRASGVTLAFTALPVHVEELLRAHSVIRKSDIVIPHLDDALEWCEENILSKALMKGGGGTVQRDARYYSTAWSQRQLHRSASSSSGVSLAVERGSGSAVSLLNLASREGGPPLSSRQSARELRKIIEAFLRIGSRGATADVASEQCLRSAVLTDFFDRIVINKGTVIFDLKQRAETVFFIEQGWIEILCLSESDDVTRASKVGAGGLLGEAEFALNGTYEARAIAIEDSALWVLCRDKYELMEERCPRLCILVQNCLLKSISNK